MYKKIILAILSIFLISSIFAVIPEGNIRLLAVTPEGVGTDANLLINISKGNGQIWSGIDALVGTSTQNTEKIAVELLSKYGDDSNEYDYFFTIQSSARLVDGPSAGVPTALLLIHMFTNKHLPNYVSGTGTISSTGQVGKIGGLLEKTKFATSTGIKIFFVPKSELEVVIKENDEVKKVNLSNYANETWNIKVIGIDNIEEMLEYNLKDLQSIKVTETKTEDKPIYDPPVTTYNKNLEQFKSYINEYKEEVSKNITLVESTLKDVDLENNDLLTELYSTLTDAKQYYKDGSNSHEKNYLYSSANYFFRANVNLNLTYDLSTHSDILTNPQKLNDLVNQLKKEYPLELNKIPCNNYEWYVAGQERYLWATRQIDNVLTTPGIDMATNLERLYSYEEAKEWLKIAKLFSSYAQIDNCYLEQKPYKNSSDDMLAELKKATTLIQKYDLMESNKWVDGAKDANIKEWYFASIFESATALAMLNSYLELKDENYDSTKELARKIISNIENDKADYIWTDLYLQHAKYYFSEAEFYESKDNNTSALDAYKNAYQLAMFAKNLQQVVEDIEKNKKSITYIASGNNIIISKDMKSWDLYKTIAFVLILVVLILVVIIILFYSRIRKNNLSQYVYSIDSKTNQLRSLLVQLEKDYRLGKISVDNYKSTMQSYSKEIDFLETERKIVQTKIQEITSLESQISNKQSLLDSLKEKYSHNLISLNDYLRKLKEYDYEMKVMKKKIDLDYKSVSETMVTKETRVYNFKPIKKPKKKKNLSEYK